MSIKFRGHLGGPRQGYVSTGAGLDRASLRILSVEIQYQDTAVKSAEKSLAIAKDRYSLGIDPYLNVLTAQTTLLSNWETAVNLRIQQMTSSGGLIEALGGDWNASQLPSPAQLASNVP